MRLTFLVMLSLVGCAANATSPPEQISLTPTVAEELGFEVQVGSEGDLVLVAIRYPSVLYECLKPSATRFIVEGDDEAIISSVVTEFPTDTVGPPLLAAFDPGKGRGVVRISYSCVVENVFGCEYPWGVDYFVESVEKFSESL